MLVPSFYRLLSLPLLYGFCSLMLSSCMPLVQKADMTFINGAEPESLDPAIITGQVEGRIATSLFEGLVAHNDKGEIVPGSATHWEISPDGKVYTFHMRPNLKWSNGDPLTAHDFVEAWMRTLSPAIASEYAYQLFYIVNAEDFNSGKLKDFSKVGICATDPQTLVITLNNPTPFFLDLCAFTTLLPTHAGCIKQHGDHWIKPGKIVSNGPYLLEEWRINHKVRLRANPYYWDRENVHLQVIDILPTSNANTAFNIYHTGNADILLDKGLVPSNLLDTLKKRPDFHSSPFLGNYFYRFNVTRKPFDDVRVRKAFTLAIDKKRIVEKITKAGESIADSLVPPGIPGYQSPPGLSYNPVEARKLLAEAGYPEGKGFPVVPLLINSSQAHQGIAVEIQEMLKHELGVQVQINQQEMKVYLGSMSALDYSFCRASWVGDYNDPNTFLDMFVTGGGNNRTGWSNAKYDTLIKAAAAELNPVKRSEIFQQAEKILCSEELPILPIYYYVGIQFYDPQKIAGLSPNVVDDHPLKFIRKIGK